VVPDGEDRLGARLLEGGRCSFTVWAPRPRSVELRLEERIIPLARDERGYCRAIVEGVRAGARYSYRLDGERERPDPASALQAEGVHGRSEVVDPTAHIWRDGGWRGLPLAEYVIYELHVGTFTPAGTLAAVEARLDELSALGITALELMPLAEFPGARNWGYDGVQLFAVHRAYGGPAALARLVDACHARGLAVILDVVYNHLGPEGNYLREFGPYFTDRYRTPWGDAINFDGRGSDEVRRFFVENALRWLEDLHVDALRLDAVHGIADRSATPFLEELALEVRALEEQSGRRLLLIAESDLNDPRLIRPWAAGGLGLDAQWSDDFHHALHALITGERGGYYQDFGELGQLARVLRDGYALCGEHSRFRGRRHGRAPEGCAPSQFVVYAQDHDQVGNRALGERLSALVPREALELAACATLLSPFVPLLFMGEEHGELAPFLYFVSHGDPGLVAAVRSGRRADCARIGSDAEPPDPQAEETFARSRLDWSLREREPHRSLLALHRELLRLRRARPAFAVQTRPAPGAVETTVLEGDRVLLLLRRAAAGDDEALVVLCFRADDAELELELPPGPWQKLLELGAPPRAPERLAGGATRLALRHWGCLVYGSAR
jgi:maltooligosyltrehalose trehalohydrolase